MPRENRQRLIQQLQELRGSRIVSYITANRISRIKVPGFATQLAAEPLPLLSKLLNDIGKIESIELFLHTRGGDTNSIWPLVNAIKEFCRKFNVLVPFRAHSGGTLMCLGANEVVMTIRSELSPIDPTTGNQFNPIDAVDKKTRLGISVEDVTSYLELAKEKFELKDEKSVLEVFKILTDKINPLALGNVYRVLRQIRKLAKNLLLLHMNIEDNEKLIDDIVDKLTMEFYTHLHSINRKEASKIFGEDIIKYATEEEERLMSELLNDYVEVLKIDDRFNIKEFMGNQQQKEIEVKGAFMESTSLSFVFKAKSLIKQQSQIPPNVQIQIPPGQPMPIIAGLPISYNIEPIFERWEENTGGV